MAKRSNAGRAHFWLLLDEQRYFYLDSYENYVPTGTVTINLQLTAGQIVRVENYYSTIIYGTLEGTINSSLPAICSMLFKQRCKHTWSK